MCEQTYCLNPRPDLIDQLTEILNHYGLQHQTFKLQQEQAELNMSLYNLLNKYNNLELLDSLKQRHFEYDVIQELADNIVVLLQIAIALNLDEVLSVVEEKVHRTLNRISMEWEDVY